MSVPIEAFELAVPEADLEDLRQRLAATRWPDPLPDSGWELGTELGFDQPQAFARDLWQFGRTLRELTGG
jgi:hypothetical protein